MADHACFLHAGELASGCTGFYRPSSHSLHGTHHIKLASIWLLGEAANTAQGCHACKAAMLESTSAEKVPFGPLTD